ncbi:RNA polymerase sigma factor [Paenibacillus thermotolerans]|uniref:RNA polymerase sigma factor n=1 Tax=Paenibacillus thermotolerans TaxID=3027807 RepID=UPI002367D4EA|nr:MULTISPECIES: sigma-70 family RNA polymerase sigma factor [unclassified Paenibacillus]
MNDRDSILETFILDHKEHIYRLAYSYVNNKDDALDIVQESIYKAMKTKSRLQDPGAVKSWFYRIVVHTALDLLRKRKKIQPMEDDQLHAFMEQSEDDYADIDMDRTLRQLPEKYRTVIVLRFFEDLTFEEVAEVLNENINTVKARVYQALKLLKIQMEQPAPGRRRDYGSAP